MVTANVSLIKLSTFISRNSTTAFEQKGFGGNSMASEKHVGLLGKNYFVGRILEGQPGHDSCVILIFWLLETCDFYKKILFKNTQCI